MQFVFVSTKGRAAPIAYRMQEEGAEVGFYIHHPRYQVLYGGLLKNKLHGADDLASAVREFGEATLCFDEESMVEQPGGDDKIHERDLGVLRARGIAKPISPRLFGPWADELSHQGRRVLFSSARTSKAQSNRDAGRKLALHLNIKAPRCQNCQSRADLLSFLSANRSTRWVLHPIEDMGYPARHIEHESGELLEKLTGAWGDQFPKDYPVTVDEYIEGFTYIEESWWNGSGFSCLNASIEDRWEFSDEVGTLLESALSAVWMKRRSIVPWEALAVWIKASKYIGPVSVRTRIDREGRPWFTGWRFGLRYDASFAFLELSRAPISRFLREDFRTGFNDEAISASVRGWIHPYPHGTPEQCQELLAGESVRSGLKDFYAVDVLGGARGLEVAGADGFLGAAVDTDSGVKLERVFRSAVKRIERVTSSVRFKNDLAGIIGTWERAKPFGLLT